MGKITTLDLKEVISVAFEKPFHILVRRKFAENNYAKYLFIKECKNKGMSLSVIAKHLDISTSAVSRYLNEYSPDIYVKELYEARYNAELKKRTMKIQ